MHTTLEERELYLRVARREVVADRVVMLELEDPSGQQLPAWTPGAHTDLRLQPGITRQYSLCGDPSARDVWRIAVLHELEGRGGSEFVHEQLHEGALVECQGPRNHFMLEPSPRYVFIAGGIGITPILPMIGQAEASGADWSLHYGGRSRTSMAFHASLEERYGSRVHLTPQDEMGRLDLTSILGTPQKDTLIYCCGPEALLGAVEEASSEWPSGALHVERFAPKEQGEPVLHTSFEVELAQSGLTLTVPVDQSILDVVDAAGVHVLYSCKEGTCGTCEVPVLEGTVDHRDSLLSEEERASTESMFICVSRAACPRLVLDI